MKKRLFLVYALTVFAFGSQSFAKTVTLDELKHSQAGYVPVVSTNASRMSSNYWAYKSLEGITRKYGLLVGDAGEKFDASKPITRSEAAVILVNVIAKVEQDRINISESEKTQLSILRNELSSEIDALTGRVAALETSVGSMQKSVDNLQTANSKVFKGGFGEDFKLNGSLQFRYNGNVRKGLDSATYPSNFSIPIADLRFSGKAAPHINYLAQLNPQRTWGGSSSLTTSGGLLGDVYASTDIIKNHTIYLGQTRIPIGMEGVNSPLTLTTIDKAQIARNFSDYRDVGIKVAGAYPFMDYYLGLYNGAGQNYKDLNNNVGFGGWVTTKPLYKTPKYGSLELGGGYYRQQYGNTTNPTLSTEYNAQTVSAGLGYKYKKVGLKSEWAYKHGYGSRDVRAKGMFAMGTYDLTKKLQLVAKYDVFDPNTYIASNTNTEYTLGTNYFFSGQNLKLQFFGQSVNNKSGKDSKRVMVLTQYMF